MSDIYEPELRAQRNLGAFLIPEDGTASRQTRKGKVALYREQIPVWRPGGIQFGGSVEGHAECAVTVQLAARHAPFNGSWYQAQPAEATRPATPLNDAHLVGYSLGVAAP